jgi:hypothetical protein
MTKDEEILVLAAQLAEARAALERFTTFAWSGVTVSWDKKTRSSEAEAYLMSHVNNARDVLAAPAPRADLIAAQAALAEACSAYQQSSAKAGNVAECMYRMEEAEANYRQKRSRTNGK